MGALEDLIKARDGWIHQKDNKLTEARICDASITALNGAIELVEAEAKKTPKKKTETTE